MAYSPEVTREILRRPAAQPPPGVTPNLINPENLRTSVVILSTLVFSISFLAVSIRMYTKWYVIRSVGWDDCKFCFL